MFGMAGADRNFEVLPKIPPIDETFFLKIFYFMAGAMYDSSYI